jgi:hypothetical protein
MPKSAVVGPASRRRGQPQPAELPDVVEGQIAELCRDLAVEAKRIRQLQEQADELRRVIREWTGRRAFAFGIGNRANYRTRRATHAPPALIGHSYLTSVRCSVWNSALSTHSLNLGMPLLPRLAAGLAPARHGTAESPAVPRCTATRLSLSTLAQEQFIHEDTINDDERNDQTHY